MSPWGWILLASAAAYATKFAGFLVPPRWLDAPRARAAAIALTIGLLASLTAVNTFASGQALAFDARIAALLAAGVALALRAPFLLVVVTGAVAAAVVRLF
ncbi:AzlD domain-containing protein [Luteimonas granuli]|uniref:AzlD domain-containing protein n=1 Tax=Luteimonas granuli TaxID=1176533 RepID=A0A518N6S6_9GAMM|nr:AzlD domain-containing protein [Luteimonas granuli]QDW67613.1 AzlD domain-containing protein [Luteimonas granuli]